MVIKFSNKELDSDNFTQDDINLVVENLRNDALSQNKIEELQSWLALTGFKVEL